MKIISILLITLILGGCKENNKEMDVFINLDKASNHVTESFDDKKESLMISDELNDPMGINMAIIVDEILAKGYTPNGFEQKNGYRIYDFIRE